MDHLSSELENLANIETVIGVTFPNGSPLTLSHCADNQQPTVILKTPTLRREPRKGKQPGLTQGYSLPVKEMDQTQKQPSGPSQT